jgi:hypothetical protein
VRKGNHERGLLVHIFRQKYRVSFTLKKHGELLVMIRLNPAETYASKVLEGIEVDNSADEDGFGRRDGLVCSF